MSATIKDVQFFMRTTAEFICKKNTGGGGVGESIFDVMAYFE